MGEGGGGREQAGMSCDDDDDVDDDDDDDDDDPSPPCRLYYPPPSTVCARLLVAWVWIRQLCAHICVCVCGCVYRCVVFMVYPKTLNYCFHGLPVGVCRPTARKHLSICLKSNLPEDATSCRWIKARAARICRAGQGAGQVS